MLPLREAAEDIEYFRTSLEQLGPTTESVAADIEQSWNSLGATAEAQIGNAAAGAFDAYADSMQAAFKTGEFSAKSFEKAMKIQLANSLKSIGQEAAIEGIFSTAKGIGMLASPVTAPLAAPHFYAAAQFFGVAAIAGAAAGALGASGGGGGKGGAGDGGGGASSGAVQPEGADSEEEAGNDIQQRVIVIGNLDIAAAENLHTQLKEAEKSKDLS